MTNPIDFKIRASSRFNFGWILLGMVLVIAEAAAAAINVSPDRNPVRINESFTLTFTASDSPDGEPDFSVLEQDFEILNQGRSSNISLINGEYSKSVSWNVNLMARKTGRLFVPPVSFGQDHSHSLHLEVLDAIGNDADQESELLLEVSARPENPYVQAQVIYTVQFLRRVELAQASLSEPVLEGAIIQKLDDDRNFTVRRNGHPYAVTERRYAIFPQQSGLVAIPPLELKADVVTSGNLGFFNRPSTRLRRIQSNAVALDVRPVPAEFKGDHWFPAEQVVLFEQWSSDPPEIAVGEPLTRTLKLTATGAPLSLLPELGKLSFKGPTGEALKQYPDQPVLEEKKSFSGIVGSREQKVALIPARPGSFHSDAQEIAWWNTRTDRLEITRLPGITIKALPAAGNTATNSSVELPKAHDLTKDPVESPGTLSYAYASGETGDGVWFWVSVSLAFGWGATLIVLAMKRFASNREETPDESQGTASERRAIRDLKMACRDNAPLAAKEALLTWGSVQWPDSIPRNLAALAAQCDAKLGAEVLSLNQSLYSRAAGAWNGAGCWDAFSNYAGQQSRPKPIKRGVDLEPLFKAR
ncbi:MAG: BatD family protein [Methylococcaceae bacterium]|nr:BatD family protein [Methylococcaceae bacterium]MCI0733485.1 BatD family protein [Methylococcaceae bacterium]